ncbi:MAG: hypothetical protein OZ948_15125 [Deltaproteobacteria bacterium]|nr:hypothetical protein [Deltaproteobacteria bacterium]
MEVALVQLRSDLLQWARQPENYDKELVGAIANLLLRREYDSAIRKAFLILTERMRAQFGAPATVDGEDLVNHAFGKQASPSLPEPTRVALRNLFAGVYVLFRNRFSHQHVAPTFAETDAAIGVVNWALHELDKLP